MPISCIGARVGREIIQYREKERAAEIWDKLGTWKCAPLTYPHYMTFTYLLG